jgi:hypothetical protein
MVIDIIAKLHQLKITSFLADCAASRTERND